MYCKEEPKYLTKKHRNKDFGIKLSKCYNFAEKTTGGFIMLLLKKLQKIFVTTWIYFVTIQLAFFPILPSSSVLHAKNKKVENKSIDDDSDDDSDDGDDFTVRQQKWVNNALFFQQQAKNFAMQTMQIQAQNAAAIAAAKQISALRPDSQLQQSKVFPACLIGHGVTTLPKNVCEQISDDTDSMVAQQYYSLAVDYESFYMKQLSKVQNTPVTVGTQCLKEQEETVMNQITSLINALQVESDKYTSATKEKINVLKNDLRKMEEVANILNGSGDADNKEKAKQFLEERVFKNDTSCRRAIDRQGYFGKGLYAVRDDIANSQTKAEYIINNEATIKTDLENDIKKIVDDFKESGYTDWTKSGLQSISTERFAGLQTAVGDEVKKFQAAYDRSASFLKENFNYKFPPLDANFDTRINAFIPEAEKYLVNKSIHDCVTKADDLNIGLSYKELLQGITQVTADKGKSAPAANTYKLNLEKFFNKVSNNITTDEELPSQTFIQDMLIDLVKSDKALDNTVRIRVKITGINGYPTPSQYFDSLITKCKQLYNDNKLGSINDPNGLNSIKKKVEMGMKYITEVRERTSGLTNNFANAARKQILECSYRTEKCSSEQEPDIYDPKTNPSFCLATAKDCSTHINACYNKVKTVIAQIETEQKARADKYNQVVRNIVNQQKQIKGVLANRMLQTASFIQAKLKGDIFTMPEGFLIEDASLDELSDLNGLKILGGDEPEKIFEQLPEKIKQLKGVLEDQKRKSKAKIDTYISEQESATKTNMSEWKDVQDKCKNNLLAYEQNINKMQQEQYKKMQEQQEAIGEFCRKASRLTCSNISKIADAATKAAALISDTTNAMISEFEDYCTQKKESRDAQDPERRKMRKDPEAVLCNELGGNTRDDELLAYFKNYIKDNAKKLLALNKKTQKDSESDISEKELISLISDSESTSKDIPKSLKGSNIGKFLDKYFHLKDGLDKAKSAMEEKLSTLKNDATSYETFKNECGTYYTDDKVHRPNIAKLSTGSKCPIPTLDSSLTTEYKANILNISNGFGYNGMCDMVTSILESNQKSCTGRSAAGDSELKCAYTESRIPSEFLSKLPSEVKTALEELGSIAGLKDKIESLVVDSPFGENGKAPECSGYTQNGYNQARGSGTGELGFGDPEFLKMMKKSGAIGE